MAIYVFNAADLHDPDDPQGRGYRQVNAEKQHQIPIGALVELVLPLDDDWFTEEDRESDGVRMFVVYHGRDCDQTPLYYLSHDPNDTHKEREHFINRTWVGGYSDTSLRVIRPPKPRPPNGSDTSPE